MKWSEQAWKSIEQIYSAIVNMPFIEELKYGNLSSDKFEFYINQDALYLEQFGRVLAHIGSKLQETKSSLAYIQFSQNALIVENALHASYIQNFTETHEQTLAPACHQYTNFLKSVASFDTIEVAMAATLPCFWIYKKVGDYILANHTIENNPYQKWIDTYGGEEFGNSVQLAINLCDAAAESTNDHNRAKMIEVFHKATIFEYDFWDDAYQLKKWEF